MIDSRDHRQCHLLVVSFVGSIHENDIVIHLEVSPHLGGLDNHLVDISISLIVFIGIAELRVFGLHVIQKGQKLLDVSGTVLASARLNVDDHMIYLLKTNVG